MLQEVKTPYYPNAGVLSWETPLGSIETSYPTLYEKPVSTRTSNVTVVRVDALEAVKELIGDFGEEDRDKVYMVVSGSCAKDEYDKIFNDLYNRLPAFTNFIDGQILFGRDISCMKDLISPLRNLIDTEINKVAETAGASRGKMLMITHDYVYVSYLIRPPLNLYNKYKVIGGL